MTGFHFSFAEHDLKIWAGKITGESNHAKVKVIQGTMTIRKIIKAQSTAKKFIQFLGEKKKKRLSQMDTCPYKWKQAGNVYHI